jgi:hypothetical protein
MRSSRQADQGEQGSDIATRATLCFPSANARFRAKFAGEACRIAQRDGQFFLAAPGGKALGEMRIVIGDQLVNISGGKPGETRAEL